MIRKYKIPFLVTSTIAVALLFWFYTGNKDTQQELTTTAFVANFEDFVITSGELKAKNSENILAPSSLQSNGFWRVVIENMVDEGTYVKEGDFVCSLDRADLKTKINETKIDLDKAQNQYTQTKLDTSLTLREKRNDLTNTQFQITQKEIELKQSAYEPPATIQKLKFDLDKLIQDLKRAQENYKIIVDQSSAKMGEANAVLQQKKNKVVKLENLETEFTINAPKDGMVIYASDWDGNKIKVGSQVSAWDPTVATLPDLSRMLSTTYVNEVDIRKVEVGQQVFLGLDAFPSAKLTGKITRVANVGETRKGSDSKVFEVVVEVNESDSTYRPGMTTSNHILTAKTDSVLQIPVEAVFGNDTIDFVYLNSNATRKEVKLGAANDKYVIVKKGLNEGDEIYLSEPKSSENTEIILLNE